MKKANSKKLLVALLVLNLSGTYTPNAHAGTFDSLKEKAAKLLEKSKEVGSKALEKGKEITIVLADYANEKLEESRDRYDDLQNGKTTDTQSNSSTSSDIIEDLPEDSKISLNEIKESKNTNDANTQKTNSNNVKIIASGSSKNEIKKEETSTNEDQHLGTISEKNQNSSQTQKQPNLSQEKKVALFPWENEAPRFQANTQTNIYNSSYSFRRNTRPNSVWAFISVQHQESGKSEDYIYRVEGGEISGTISLRHGAGTYAIGVHETSEDNQYGQFWTVAKYNLQNLDTRDLSFLLPSKHVQSQNEEIVELAKRIVSGSKSQREAVVRINRWMMDNIEYDWSAYRDGSYVKKSYTASETLESRVAVCQGFANLFAAIARASGIKTRFVSGLGVSNAGSGAHAWNQVYIEGQWLNIDSTWDQNLNNTVYIFMSDANFEKTHQNPKIKEDF